jgi:hypothetical protein
MSEISAKLATIIDQILKEYAGACSDLYKKRTCNVPHTDSQEDQNE